MRPDRDPEATEGERETDETVTAARRLTPALVVDRVRACLAGHDDLLDGFRAFLPEVRDARGDARAGAR